MLYRILGLYALLHTLTIPARAQTPPIGQWRDHLPYQQATRVAATANKIWASTPYSIFSVNENDNSIERYSKLGGLNDMGVSAMAGDAGGNQLVIAYNNSNIDVVSNDNVSNIPALKNSTATGDKTVNSIFIQNRQAYLCTGMGIVVIDLDRLEIKDTWIIGNGGARIAVQSLTFSNGSFYAATQEGVKKGSAGNLADFRNWQWIAPAASSIAALQNQVVAVRNDSLFYNWSFVYSDGRAISDMTVSSDKVLLSEAGRVMVLNAGGVPETTIATAFPKQAVLVNNSYWIADSTAGLLRYNSGSFTPFVPNAPGSVATGNMTVAFGKLLVAAGIGKDGFFQLSDGEWKTTRIPGFADLTTVVMDPIDKSIWAGSWGTGLAHIKTDNSIIKYGPPIQPAYFAPGSYRVAGLAFDAEQNLWVTNYGGEASALHVKKPDGTWRSFALPFPVAERAVSQVVVDDLNQKWMVLPKGGGLACFNHGASIDNPADDQWKWYRSGKGNGNLPDNNVLCIAKDKENFLWVGTTRGIGVIQCASDVFNTTGCEAVLPVVQQDAFAGYLFRDEQVQSIAVDGANRKWVATKNGVWLISADGSKTLLRFTETNSPLLSNDVNQIAVDPVTGEVFFSTARGICSYRSTATETSSANSDVVVFPNPVPPAYTGSIAIRGIANNAIVKITELDGRLVYQTRALGGQAIWNGKDYKGRTIATGVYLVLVSTGEHTDKMVSKIVFINK